ncbi:MAG: amidase [Dehalococcoidia bacterium]|nr:MAG: amidase [Dehalococcoidia bacterium]
MPDATIDLGALTIAEASTRIAAGTLSPLALTEAAFARIDATNPRINTFVRLMRASAIAEAEAAEARAHTSSRLGPLDGIPFAVKDLFDTAGVVTAAGTSAYRERVPTEDATAVRRLREAGAVLLGKTNTHELALGGTTNNVHHGPTRNPWRLDRVPGGSSGGSGAALAAGQALGALGTDTGGSIRIPAAFCGVTGHKPSYGLVGRGGVVPLSLTLDHAGPMARTALDCALILDVLAGYDARDPDSVERPSESFSTGIDRDIRGLRVAVIPSLVEGSSEATLAAFEAGLDVLRGLGVTVGTVEPMAGHDEWRASINGLLVAEGASYIAHILRERPQTIGESVRRRMLTGLDISATAYIKMLAQRAMIERMFEASLREGEFDAYVTPTSPQPAEPIVADPNADSEPPTKFRITTVFDLTRQPSISVPAGFDGDGMPIGFMISGARWTDALVLRIAHAFQQATTHHAQRPTP